MESKSWFFQNDLPFQKNYAPEMQNPPFTDGVNSLSAYPQGDRKSPAALGAFVFPSLLHLLRLHSGSLVVLVIALSMPFSYTYLAISGKEIREG
nr:hypothetical protein [uncultured Oscillibacter sp.]